MAGRRDIDKARRVKDHEERLAKWQALTPREQWLILQSHRRGESAKQLKRIAKGLAT